MSTPDKPTRKDARLAVRLTPEQDHLIRGAAAVCGLSITDFVTTAAVASAEDTLTDRRLFRLDDAAWTEFATILDRPAEPIPELVRLLAERAPWDDPSSR